MTTPQIVAWVEGLAFFGVTVCMVLLDRRACARRRREAAARALRREADAE